MKLNKILLLVVILYGFSSKAQILTQGRTEPGITNSSVLLDGSTYYSAEASAGNNVGKGIVIPSVNLINFEFDLTYADGVIFPTYFDGMLVYNNATGTTQTTGNRPSTATAVTPGFYYFSNPNGAANGNVTGGVWTGVGSNSGLPSLTSAQRNAIASPATGLTIYNTTTNCLNFFNGTAWNESCGTVLPPTIVSTTGREWMDRNLGATRVAQSADDYLAYGDLYQWGRNADGHEKITWTSSNAGTPVNGTTTTRATGDQAATPLFIVTSSGSNDWRATQNDNLWQGVAGVNNPCPTGFRLPTLTEMAAEITAYSINTGNDTFASPLNSLLQAHAAHLLAVFMWKLVVAIGQVLRMGYM